MIPHYVLFVHGMGDNRAGFSRPLRRLATEAFRATLARIAPQYTEECPLEIFPIREVVWSEITQADQNNLWNRLFPQLGTKSLSWRSWLTKPEIWLPRIRYWAPGREFVLSYLGDPIVYVESPGINKYAQIQQRIWAALDQCADDAGQKGATADKPALITVVAHSLGSVIVSDLVYDSTVLRRRAWPPKLRLANLVTLGSPLAIYALRFGLDKDTRFASPIRMQDQDGLWVNLYDPQDILGFPLKPINAEYGRAVFLDKEINAGQGWKIWQWWKQATPLSHALYWEDDTVAATIGRKAALDWIRENPSATLPPAQLPQLYTEYKEWLARA